MPGRKLGAAVLVALLCSLTAAGVAVAKPRTYEVTRGGDPAPGGCKPKDCSLREALLAANRHGGRDSVVLKSGRVHKLTRVGDSLRAGSFDVSDTVRIRSSARKRAIVDGGLLDTVLAIQAGSGLVRVKRIVIRHGSTTTGPGGGIAASGGVLDLRHTVVTRNRATGGAAAGVFTSGRLKLIDSAISRNHGTSANWGGLEVYNRAEITRSKITGNTAGAAAGASLEGPAVIKDTLVARNSVVDPSGNAVAGIGSFDEMTITGSEISENVGGDSAAGGLSSIDGRLTVRHTLFAGNEGVSGAAISAFNSKVKVSASRLNANRATNGSGGAINAYGEPFTVSRSTLSANVAAGEAGAISVDNVGLRISQSTLNGNRGATGGAVMVRNGTATISNSTIYGNAAVRGGGLALGTGGIYVLNAVSAIGNRARPVQMSDSPLGGGLANLGGTFNVQNSLIALNTVEGGTGPDCDGEFVSGGHNLLSDATDCTGFDLGSDITNPAPKLGQLANNGGPTKTVALRKGSPAIGKAGKSSAPKRDQRGHERDKHPDIGAYER